MLKAVLPPVARMQSPAIAPPVSLGTLPAVPDVPGQADHADKTSRGREADPHAGSQKQRVTSSRLAEGCSGSAKGDSAVWA
jgi:hypothetical protein